MKKLLAIALVLCVVFTFAACGQTEEEKLEAAKQAYNDFSAAVNAESVIATNARIITDSNGAKMLVTDIQNNGDKAASEVVVCFAVWDTDGAPMPVKTKRNPENSIFEFQMDVTDVTVEAGKTWSENKGLYLAEGIAEIGFAKAVVVSCKIGEDTYENPHYEAWKETYLQQHLTDYMK